MNAWWGFGAVFIPEQDFCRGFSIDDPDSSAVADAVASLLTGAELFKQTNPGLPAENVMAAELVSAVVDKAAARVDVLAPALAKLLGKRFWIITASIRLDGLMVTKVTAVEGIASAAEAQEAINRWVKAYPVGAAAAQPKAPERTLRPPRRN